MPQIPFSIHTPTKLLQKFIPKMIFNGSFQRLSTAFPDNYHQYLPPPTLISTSIFSNSGQSGHILYHYMHCVFLPDLSSNRKNPMMA